MIDGVPLFMGEDEAEHSAELLRTLVWAVFRGQEGFLTSVAGRCEPMIPPDRGVRILPGPFVVLSKFAGGDMQSYLARIINDEICNSTDVPAGVAGGFRHDLLVMNIEDPTPSNGVQWPLPQTDEGRRLGPYWRPRLIENVPSNCMTLEQIPANHPSGARYWTAIPSARLKRPANSAAITADMIVRLNSVINPLAGISIPRPYYDDSDLVDAISDVASVVGGIASGRIPIPGEYVDSKDCKKDSGNLNRLHYSDNNYKNWPREAIWTDVFVPTWATHGELFVVVNNPYQKATAANQDAHIWGDIRLDLSYGSTTASSGADIFDSDEINSFDNRAPSSGTSTAPGSGRPGNRPTVFLSGPLTIPTALRGKKCTAKVMARMFNDAATRGQLIADDSTSVRIEIKFKEKP